MNWSDFVIHFGIPCVLFLLAWLVRQNNQARTAMIDNVKTLTDSVETIRNELQTYREGWMDRRESLIDIITAHCRDAQGACRKVVELQLVGLTKGQENVCNKIDALQKKRNHKWEEQDKLNVKLIIHMDNSGIHKMQP
jgi:hypothetical protein